jgi:hypothetical protein
MEDSDDSGPYTEAVTTRVTPQNYERYEDYIDRESISKSEGLRRLIRSGLGDKEGEESGDINETMDRTAVAIGSFTAAVMFLLVEYAGTSEGLSSAVGGLFILIMLGWSQWPFWRREVAELIPS